MRGGRSIGAAGDGGDGTKRSDHASNPGEQPLRLLSDVKILAFTQFLVGPAAVQYLSDLGAEVVKIEPPERGAWERSWSGGHSFLNGVSVFFMLSHRNTRSVTLNLKRTEAVQIAMQLAEQADVLVENFRPGVMERLGLGYEVIREANPAIVYASASGFGSGGPYKDLPGQDLLLQAMTGLASITGRSEELPTPTGAAVIDQHCASLLAMGILAALAHRGRTGEGQRIEATLLHAALDLQLEPIVYHLNGTAISRPREPLGSSFHPAPYGVYETSDGHIALSLSPIDSISEALSDPPSLEPFLEPMAAWERKDEIYRALAPILQGGTTARWLDLLQPRGVWCAPVLDYGQLLEDSGVKYADPFLEMEHPEAGSVRVLKHPVQYSSGRPEVRRVPPRLGEHTDEVLTELGLSRETIAEHRAAGII